MKKKIWLRGLLGFPLGIAVGHVISLIISLGWGEGAFLPCVPELIRWMGSEAGAVAFQTALCGLLGAVCGGASVIWEMENWSIVQQTGIYFAVLSAGMLPIAYLTHWMEHTAAGILSYFLIFLLIFAGMWLLQYGIWRIKIKKLNHCLEHNAKDE